MSLLVHFPNNAWVIVKDVLRNPWFESGTDAIQRALVRRADLDLLAPGASCIGVVDTLLAEAVYSPPEAGSGLGWP